MTPQHLFYHPDPVTRNIVRYGVLTPVLFLVFSWYPVQTKIDTSNTYSTTLVAADGIPLGYQVRVNKGINDIPVLWIDTATLDVLAFLIAREDPRLLEQNSLFGEFWLNTRGISARNFSPFTLGGGSTCSQQALKNISNPEMVTDSRQRTIASKLGEMAGAFKLTGVFTPPQVLQLYINEVGWLSATVKGIQLNAIKYFQVKSIHELNMYERYILARSVKGVKSAGIDFSQLMKLDRDSIDALFVKSFRSMMIGNGRATEADLKKMLAMPVRFRSQRLDLHEQYYLFDLIKPLHDSLKFEGAQYITDLQEQVVTVIDNAVAEYAGTHRDILRIGNNILDVNVVVLDIHTGKIVGVNSQPLFPPPSGPRMENHIFASRPSASPIKVLMVAEGIELGLIKENDILIDEDRGRMRNYNNRYSDSITLSDAIKYSKNTPFDNHPSRDEFILQLEKDLATVYGNEINRLPGNYSKSQYCLGESRMLNSIQQAQLFRAVVTDGIVIKTRVTNTVLNANTYPFDTVYTWQPPTFKIFSENTCRAMRRLLKAPLETDGTLGNVATALHNKEGVMGKSGTSDGWEVGWVVMITPSHVIAVSMRYWNIKKNTGTSKLPIPTRTGAGSCGPIVVSIINSL